MRLEVRDGVQFRGRDLLKKSSARREGIPIIELFAVRTGLRACPDEGQPRRVVPTTANSPLSDFFNNPDKEKQGQAESLRRRPGSGFGRHSGMRRNDDPGRMMCMPVGAVRERPLRRNGRFTKRPYGFVSKRERCVGGGFSPAQASALEPDTRGGGSDLIDAMRPGRAELLSDIA